MTNPSPPIPYIHQPHMVHAAVIPNGETNQAEDDSEAEVTLHEAHDIRKAQILDNRNFHILSFLFNTLCSGIMPPSSLFRGNDFSLDFHDIYGVDSSFKNDGAAVFWRSLRSASKPAVRRALGR